MSNERKDVELVKEIEPFSFSCEAFSYLWIESEQVLLFAPFRKLDVEDVALMIEQFDACCATLPPEDSIELLADLSQGKGLTMKARKLGAKLSQHPRLKRVSLFGMSSLDKAVMTFMMFAAGRRDEFGAHKTKDEALAWLKSKR